eukprot:TRINITY_DN441_c0_g1_i1.p1 TRINITY_DN441_c0_g1~~TRINITY_DN441_c0_g1_i1.p1  ORF type:complete len:319 (+),score=19.33 TRINITY_DN441_c0_g1_i1:9-965(+)
MFKMNQTCSFQTQNREFFVIVEQTVKMSTGLYGIACGQQQHPQIRLQDVVDRINQNASCASNITKIEINLIDLAPSGPRVNSEGTQDGHQELAYAQITSEGDVILLVTLLAAGFVVGSRGSSVQKICERSGCNIKSWNTHVPIHSQQKPKAIRVFLIQGNKFGILEAIRLISAAVDRYKLLIEGAYKDQVVAPIQVVEGIEFVYKPPPILAMPRSARTISFRDFEKKLNKQRSLQNSSNTMQIYQPAAYVANQVGHLDMAARQIPMPTTSICTSPAVSPPFLPLSYTYDCGLIPPFVPTNTVVPEYKYLTDFYNRYLP